MFTRLILNFVITLLITFFFFFFYYYYSILIYYHIHVYFLCFLSILMWVWFFFKNAFFYKSLAVIFTLYLFIYWNIDFSVLVPINITDNFYFVFKKSTHYNNTFLLNVCVEGWIHQQFLEL